MEDTKLGHGGGRGGGWIPGIGSDFAAIRDSLRGLRETPTTAPSPPPTPIAPPLAELHTSIGGRQTVFRTWTPREGYSETVIPTRVEVDRAAAQAHPGAGGAFTTNGIVGISNRHAGKDAYGPSGAFIDVGDPRGRDIHGGGTTLQHPMAPEQGWLPTDGCARGQNQDVQRLGSAISAFQRAYPDVRIPYRRTLE